MTTAISADQREVLTRAALYGLKEIILPSDTPEQIKARAVALAEALNLMLETINPSPCRTKGDRRNWSPASFTK